MATGRFDVALNQSEYDKNPEAFQQSTHLHIRSEIEEFSVSQHLNIQNADILDLGCGEGRFARYFMSNGANSVTGIDLSTALIHLAQQQNNWHGKIQYILGDVTELPIKPEHFDIVSGIYLIPLAEDTHTLERIFSVACHALKPGGIFVNILLNPSIVESDNFPLLDDYYRKYDFEISHQLPIKEGSKILVKLYNSDGSLFELIDHHYSLDAINAAANHAGFHPSQIHPVEISPKGIHSKGRKYWESYLSNPAICLLISKKHSLKTH
jgi:ubiquinone/menaquinone biosynthesis C-methylase UbiE